MSIGLSRATADRLKTLLGRREGLGLAGQEGTFIVGESDLLLVVPSSGDILGASNATPIVIIAAVHNLQTGDEVTIADVEGNEGANGTWTITVIDDTSYSLDGSSGSGEWDGASGSWSFDTTYARAIIVKWNHDTQEFEPFVLVNVMEANGKDLKAGDVFCGLRQGDDENGVAIYVVSCCGGGNCIASFTHAFDDPNHCNPATVDFTDTTSGCVDSWEWTFAGGTPPTSIEQNPSGVVFATPGPHAVTLTAWCCDETFDTIATNVIVNGPPPTPIPDVSGCNLDWTFNLTNTYESWNTPTTTLWDYGDGETGVGGEHTYDEPGIYTVEVTLSNACGSSSTVETEVEATDDICCHCKLGDPGDTLYLCVLGITDNPACVSTNCCEECPQANGLWEVTRHPIDPCRWYSEVIHMCTGTYETDYYWELHRLDPDFQPEFAQHWVAVFRSNQGTTPGLGTGSQYVGGIIYDCTTFPVTLIREFPAGPTDCLWPLTITLSDVPMACSDTIDGGTF